MIDSCTVSLRNALLSALRNCDEKRFCSHSLHSRLSLVLLRMSLSSSVEQADSSIILSDSCRTRLVQWSLNSQKVKGADVAKIDAILEDPEARTALLQRLSEKIKSERDRQRMSACV